jgi:hypothetical protein
LCLRSTKTGQNACGFLVLAQLAPPLGILAAIMNPALNSAGLITYIKSKQQLAFTLIAAPAQFILLYYQTA